MLPPRLARFCTCTPPISCADKPTAGYRRAISACRATAVAVAAAPIDDAAIGQRRDRRQLRDMLEVDDAPGRPPPLAQLRHQVGAARKRPRIARAQRRDGLLDGPGPLIDELLQRPAPAPPPALHL